MLLPGGDAAIDGIAITGERCDQMMPGHVRRNVMRRNVAGQC
jgi:hypothetical protein